MVGAIRKIEIVSNTDRHKEGNIRRSVTLISFLSHSLALSLDTFSMIRYFKADVKTNESGMMKQCSFVEGIRSNGKQKRRENLSPITSRKEADAGKT